jgi:soluble lytic murein transglycosylase
MALAAEGRAEAFEVARAAWRGGQMAENVELTIESLYARRFTPQDHAARLDALLWQGDAGAAARQMAKLAPGDRPLALARLAIINGSLPGDAGLDVPEGAYLDAGFLYNLARYHYRERNYDIAASILANRIDVAAPAFDGEKMVSLMLAVAQKASALNAARIAGHIDDFFEPGEDISAGLVHPARSLHRPDVAGWHQRPVGAGPRCRRRSAVRALWRCRAHPADQGKGLLLGRPRRPPRRR